MSAFGQVLLQRMLERDDFLLQEQGKLMGDIVEVEFNGVEGRFEVDRFALGSTILSRMRMCDIKGVTSHGRTPTMWPTATPVPTAD